MQASKPNYLVIILCCIAAWFAVFDVSQLGLTSDTDIFMHQSLLIWNHEGLYARWIQVNAPFNMMLYAPVAAFALFAPLSPSLALHGFAALICIVGLLSLHNALKAHAVAESDRRVWLAASAFLLFVPPCIFGVFADREHLLFAFGLPWILQMLLRLRPLTHTSILFGIGCCLRPHDALLFITLNLLAGPVGLSFAERIFSRSSLIIGAILIAYAASVLLFFPAYLTTIMPIASLTYTSTQFSMPDKIISAAIYLIAIPALMVEFIKVPGYRLPWYGFCLCIIALYVLNSGWEYTRYLLVAPLVLLSAAVWCSPFKKHLLSAAVTRTLSCIVLAVFSCMSVRSLQQEIFIHRTDGHSVWYHHLPAELSAQLHNEAGDEFILLSSSLWNIDIEPLGGKPKSLFAFDDLWPLFWLFKHPDDPHFGQVLHFVTDRVAGSMSEHPGAPIIIDTSPQSRLSPHSEPHIREFLSQDPHVRDAFAFYERTNTLDFCKAGYTTNCRYEVWRRRGG